jgi:hypothetical protein
MFFMLPSLKTGEIVYLYMEAVMKITNRSTWRLLMITGYGAIVLSMLACVALGGGVVLQEGSLRLDDGIVQVKDTNGDWVPVAGEATFDLAGKLENTDPWTVSGRALVTNESTQIEEGLQVDDFVRVRGTVLQDDTWVAYSIERVEELADPTVVLIGVVDSIDPWVVNGITLNVTDETDIQGAIRTGMVVRVQILLLSDGTWEVLSIAPLGETTETSGCVTVIATVVSVNGNQIQFLGWPSTVIFSPGSQIGNDNNNDDNNENDNGNENDNQNANGNDNENGDVDVPVDVGDTVSAVICATDDGQLIIVQIVIIDEDEEGEAPSEPQGEKVLVCHKPDKKGGHTLSLPQSAVPAHLGHGDTLGACP